MFERAVTLIVRASELTGERAIGISSEKSLGPTPADRLKIQLSKPSVFRDVVEKGRVYYGESGDETLRTFFTEIGMPLSHAIVLPDKRPEGRRGDIRRFWQYEGAACAAWPDPFLQAGMVQHALFADRWLKRLKIIDIWTCLGLR
jgi:hypothetical protein